MIVRVIADPQNWQHWEQAKAYLEPARARGGFEAVIEPDEELFAVLDPLGGLLAVATAWFDVGEKRVEVKLVGGREFRRWIKQMDEAIGAAAAAAGATRMVAIGRCGWAKVLPHLGWAQCGEVDADTFIYSRELGN